MQGDLANLTVGDYNGDGKDDFIRQEKGSWDDDTNNTANVYLSNGNGTFWKQDLTNQADMKGDLTNLIVGDFNGDKKTDFIRQEKGDWDNDDNNTANVYLSNGNGTFWKQDLTNWREMKGDLSNIITTSPKLLPGHLTGDIENKGLSWQQDYEYRYHNNGVNLYRYDSSGRTYQGIESNKDTILVIHGWTDKSDSDLIKSLSTKVADKYKNYQVLALDWENPAKDTPNSGSFDQDYNNGRDNKPGVPWHAARSIAPVAEWAVNTLKSLGIAGEQISLFGHSLGSYVSAEIGWLFGGVKNIVALDPAYPGDRYDIDGNKPNDQRVSKFKDVATKSYAFVVANVAGDPERAGDANYSFIVDSGDLDPSKAHGAPIAVFRSLIDQGKFSPSTGLSIPTDLKENWYLNSGWKSNSPAVARHEGTIKVKGDNNLNRYADSLTYVYTNKGDKRTI